jgi:hypothetical protein
MASSPPLGCPHARSGACWRQDPWVGSPGPGGPGAFGPPLPLRGTTHDGLGLLAEALSESLQTRAPAAAPLAAKVAAGLRRVLAQVRAYSRGLTPVETRPGSGASSP